jgi:endogenous inhibitor of DNA gyrase (YacG/DUF329 family)
MHDQDANPDNKAPGGLPKPANDPAPQTMGACPMCGKPAELKYRPFCSKRCADLDLSRWLNGVYAVPVEPKDEEDEEV